MKTIIEITDCRDCPFANDHRGHGECWKECRHPQHNQGAYGNILWGCQEQFKATPTWCPLKEKNTVVSTAPDRIWLDLGFDPQDEYEIIFHELHDVTWSQDNASGNGIEYVRADITPPKRPWQGLTDEEIDDIYWGAGKHDLLDARAIEAKLKERNT